VAVFTLCATKRLISRLKVAPVAEAAAPTTLLGDWYANLLHVGRLQLVLAVSERTFLPVVVPAAPGGSVVDRLRIGVGEVLRALDVDGGAIAREVSAMDGVAFGKATNRQAIGVMIEFARLLPFYVEEAPSLLAVSLKLADTPCGPLYKSTVFPNRTAEALFEPDSGAAPRRVRRPIHPYSG
jgi:hypothetical protein